MVWFSVDKYKNMTSEELSKTSVKAPKVVSSNPLDNLDCEYFIYYICRIQTWPLDRKIIFIF